ncbi:MAG: hypothetical protein CSA26_09955 [Desulfobacterales bacterium]|nr:MAG: hypothetical protein CSA26_09955 [Desulfobacterales bacterium]
MIAENVGISCHNRRGAFYIALCLVILFMPCISSANTGSEVKKMSEKAVEIGVTTQGVHESWVEEEHKLLEEIEDLEQVLEHTRWQRKKFFVYRQDLEKKIAGLQKKAEAMEAVNMKLLPILEENLGQLQTVMDADIPSNLTERRKSIHHAKMVLADYDMGLLDKTRAVLDAIAKEVDLGHQVNVLEDEIEVDGVGRRVKMLQVGRVGLYAMTLDGEKAYQWDNGLGQWVAIADDVTPIHDAIEIAEGIRLVGLSRLPLAQPETSSMQEGTVQ